MARDASLCLQFVYDIDICINFVCSIYNAYALTAI